MEKEDKIMTILTLWCTFLMGYIDTYAFLSYDHLLVSAQTGNMVLLGANLTNGADEVLPHVTSFVGFLIGAFLTQGLVEIIKRSHDIRRFTIYIALQIIILFTVVFLEKYMSVYIFALVMSAFAGYNLTVFNRVRSTTINNSIMTGNVQKFMTQMYLVIFERDEEAIQTSKIIFSVIVLFILGILTSTFLHHYFTFNMMFFIALLASMVCLYLVINSRKVVNK